MCIIMISTDKRARVIFIVKRIKMSIYATNYQLNSIIYYIIPTRGRRPKEKGQWTCLIAGPEVFEVPK